MIYIIDIEINVFTVLLMKYTPVQNITNTLKYNINQSVVNMRCNVVIVHIEITVRAWLDCR